MAPVPAQRKKGSGSTSKDEEVRRKVQELQRKKEELQNKQKEQQSKVGPLSPSTHLILTIRSLFVGTNV